MKKSLQRITEYHRVFNTFSECSIAYLIWSAWYHIGFKTRFQFTAKKCDVYGGICIASNPDDNVEKLYKNCDL